MKPMMKPILFKTDMVQAILSGRKTVTRRIIKPQPLMQLCYINMGSHNVGKWCYPSEDTWKYWGEEWKRPDTLTEEEAKRLWTPPCHTDDILYVRETWARLSDGRYMYKANFDAPMPETWRPSLHMPKEAARLFLKVNHVGVERLQDITMEEIVKEGCVPSCMMCSNFNKDYWCNELFDEEDISCTKGITRAADCALETMFPDTGFMGLWDRMIRKEDLSIYGWAANPYVWRIEFERIDKAEAESYL